MGRLQIGRRLKRGFLSYKTINMNYSQERIKPYAQDGEKGQQVELMFDRIAHSYDKLNHLFSMKIDKKWRRAAIAALRPYRPGRILDVATGTGDFAFLAAKELKPKEVVGIDFSEGMLKVGRQKAQEMGLEAVVTFRWEDCMDISMEGGTFDAVMAAYGVRNFQDLEKGLGQMLRMLKPGGRMVIIELTTPGRFPMKQLFHLYSRVLMPAVGRIVSKDSSAYSYLLKTMDAFPQGAQMKGILEKVGFKDVAFKHFTFGISTLYTGCRSVG